MEFRTQYSIRERYLTDAGSRIKISYGASYDKNGRLILEEKGKENLYDYIQSFADSVDIHVLLKRYSNGEVDVLSKVQGQYGDFTVFPSTYADLLNSLIRGEEFFNKLSPEIRSRFNNSFPEFITAAGDVSFYERLGLKVDSEAVHDKGDDEVKEHKEVTA